MMAGNEDILLTIKPRKVLIHFWLESKRHFVLSAQELHYCHLKEGRPFHAWSSTKT